MFNAAKIAELEDQLAAAQARVTQLEGDHTTATAEITRLQGEITRLNAELATALSNLTAANEAHATEVARLNGDFETRVQNEVTTRCAAAGIAPIARDPAAVAPAAETVATPGAGLTGIAKARAALAAKHKELHGGN